ncbi:MAG: YerC/YecD family TrpR-related protein [Patescibacteria group bacterium]
MANWYNQKVKNLFAAVLKLKTPDEARRFFRDLLTEQEILEFANRWQAAQLLDRGVPYSTISAKTGLSSTTIARISRWLYRGLNGYQLMLKRLNLHHRNSASFEKGLR